MTNVRASAPHLVVGLCFMLLGAMLVLDKLEVLDAGRALQFWPVGLVLLGASMMIQAVRGASESTPRRGDFPVGAVIWLVLLGVLLTYTFERRGDAARNEDGQQMKLFALMSGDKRASAGERFSGGEMTSLMGGTELDLTQARMAPGDEAVVDVFAVMGGAILHVPKHWIVDVQATAVMGGIKDERNQTEEDVRRRRSRRGEMPPEPAHAGPSEQEEPTAPVEPTEPAAPVDPLPIEPLEPVEATGAGLAGVRPPRIVVRGFVMMGGLVIKP